jgi:hypothetical protein
MRTSLVGEKRSLVLRGVAEMSVMVPVMVAAVAGSRLRVARVRAA